MASLDEEITALKEEIEGYELESKDATSREEKSELRGLIKSRSDNLTELLKLKNAQSAAVDYVDREDAHSAGIQFKEIRPQAINGETLHERLEASKALAFHLLNSGGSRVTPICDNMFGSGKTSLVFKFRSVLNSAVWPERPVAYESLRTAVYLHIPFEVRGTMSQTPIKLVLDTVRKALRLSCGSRADFDGDNIPAFLHTVTQVIGSTRFLFHFDDVGCYEPLGSAFGAAMIYTIWSVADTFRSNGHFFVMTGRSSLLHLIGTGRVQSRAYSSPDRTVIIRLPPLSKSAVEAIILEFGLERVVDQAEAIHTLTGGVPRAVYAVVRFFKMNTSARTVEERIDEIMEAVMLLCPQFLMAADRSCFQRCVEFSWAGISFTDDAMINDEPITSMMARLGIFRQDCECNIRFQLLVPPFILKSLLPSIRSILAISEYVDKGSRLESGFRRILPLRFLFKPCSSWTDVDLPYLSECCVPFPQEHYHESFSFPKIAKQNAWTEANVQQVMDSVHNARHNDAIRQEFAHSALPTLIKYMKIGHYYQPLSMSGSADAMLKCSESDIVNFQFKNSSTPITDSAVDAEARKCLADGYSVFLIMVSTAGNARDADYLKVVDGVTVIVLSRSSVQFFLGQNCVSNFSSSCAIVDLAQRIKLSPIKTMTLSELGIQLDNLSL